MANGLFTGEPIECECGRAMVVVWTEAIYERTGTWEKKPAGRRYVYRCDACGRQCDVRLKERGARDLRRGAEAQRGEGA